MKIETERLVILPLSYPQLVKYKLNDNCLEEELKLNPTSRVISPELIEALEQTIMPAVADKSRNYLFSTLWTIILKAENKMVGDLCFVGEPNASGEIEIGYGTYAEFQGKGYMAEAVGCMVKWAYSQPAVKSVIAHTDFGNKASCRVLEKNNFTRVGKTDKLISFKLNIK